MELIDRNELFRKFETTPWFNNADRDDVAEELLYEATVVDAVPMVHGHWMPCGKYFKCSRCNVTIASIDEMIHCTGEEWHYCPNCGARMDEVDNGRTS